ncbi:hypothetical protein D2E25_1839 [Bifidobacterium goeldii]|uniref:Uncharacterized protein n=1 Tax=Bifidobacterium goeldii TaxID=2306975 RepID=A0A430FES7_9BIFI|nr:hypothetical protein D2E25_1839 [Bifidobacterium goeldii]
MLIMSEIVLNRLLVCDVLVVYHGIALTRDAVLLAAHNAATLPQSRLDAVTAPSAEGAELCEYTSMRMR